MHARTHICTTSNPKHRPLNHMHGPGGRDSENSSRNLGQADKQSHTLLLLLLERINKGQREENKPDASAWESIHLSALWFRFRPSLSSFESRAQS